MARRIDDAHQPFKRTVRIGPGPRKRPAIVREGDWECVKGKNTRTHYVQVCTFIGETGRKRGAKLTVKTKRARKKRYNKLYRAWAKKHRKALQARGPRAGYRCRRTAVAKCK